ncbi:MAG: 50S ribosomal protein L18 [Rhodospirillales bacterium]
MITVDQLFERRQRRQRYNLKSKAKGAPRLSVFRSGRHMYAQVIDDTKGATVASASTLEKDLRGADGSTGATVAAAAEIGKRIAERAKAKGIEKVVFDRGGYRYHGRIRAVAEAAREGGLNF